jgi:hypothetical protein
MSYTITITETTEQVKKESGAYAVVGHKYLSAHDYGELSFEERKDYKIADGDQYCKPVYGYPPAKEVVKEVSTEIYKQTVKELNLNSVILAVLGTNK